MNIPEIQLRIPVKRFSTMLALRPRLARTVGRYASTSAPVNLSSALDAEGTEGTAASTSRRGRREKVDTGDVDLVAP